MPKKTKSAKVRSSKLKAQTKAQTARRAGYQRFDKISLKQRKRLIADALEAIVANTDIEHREEIAAHVVDIGIELLGAAYGINTENAMVLLPEDNFTRLIMALDQHERVTGEATEDIVDKLIAFMAERQPAEARVN